jgi:hypothetical protein
VLAAQQHEQQQQQHAGNDEGVEWKYYRWGGLHEAMGRQQQQQCGTNSVCAGSIAARIAAAAAAACRVE